jgi:HK97 family phage major capsid protein
MPKWKRLLNEAAHAAKAAREIAEKADREGREMSADEKAEFDRHFAVAQQKKTESDAAKADAEVIDQAKALADELGLPGAHDDLQEQADGDGGQPVKDRVKSLGLQVVESGAFKAALGSFPDGRVPEKARFQTDPIRVKNALLTGSSGTSGGAFVVPDQSGIVEMLGRRPLVIRDVISVRRTSSDAVEYVRQTSHTNAAAPVAEATTAALPTQDATTGPLVNAAGGGYKPEGAWAFERDSATVKTIAEWVPVTKRALADVAALEGLINDELRADLAEEEEDQIMSGDGTGENLDGILNTSGTQSQTFSVDIFQTVRKALTKVRTVGRAVPNGIGLNPVDVETVDLARTNTGGANTGQYMGMGPFAMGPRTLWGVPIVESEAVPAGTAVVADWRKAVLWDREQSTITMTDSHADFFIRNLVAILGEERVAFAVTRPTAFVLAALA